MLVVGLNVPQVFKGVHDQVTPELVGSFVTIAVTVVVAPICNELGGTGLKETEIAGPVIVIVALADCVVSLIEVAVTVNEPPAGIAAGAVKEVVAVLPVLVVGLNVPHEFRGMHDQVTPELVPSFVTTAVSVVVALVCIDVGGAGLRATDIGADALVRLKLASVNAPETAAITEYVPLVELAVNTGEAATPLLSVIDVAEVAPPPNVPPAPDAGAVKVTVTSPVGAPPVVTKARRRAVNAPPMGVLCPDPLNTAIDTTGAAAGLLLLPHAIRVEIMASTANRGIDRRFFIARLPPVRPWR